MKVYSIKQTQFLPINQAMAWQFFSSPANLEKITPEHMGFSIIYKTGSDKMYAGQIIRYKVKILPWLPSIHWMTEITHVQEPFYFVDEQRFGPYTLWHHQHNFKEVPGGIEMTDEVNYALPLGLLGRFAHTLFVRGELSRIFNYRFQWLETYFNKEKEQRKSA